MLKRALSSRETTPGPEACADMLGGGRQRENKCIQGDLAGLLVFFGGFSCSGPIWPFRFCLYMAGMSPGVSGADHSCGVMLLPCARHCRQ